MRVAWLVLALWGCDGGHCTYEAAVTGTVTVTAIEAPSAGSCPTRDVRYSWNANPSRFSNFDHVFLAESSFASLGLSVGSTFQVKRQDITQGTCTPSTRTIEDAQIAACAAACP